MASSEPSRNGRPSTRRRPEIAEYSSRLTPSTSLFPELLSAASTEFWPIATADLTPSTLRTSFAIETGRRNDSDPPIPIEPDARKKISAPTFASRVACSRIVPFASPTVKTISSTPIAMPKMLTNVRAGRWSIFEKTSESIVYCGFSVPVDVFELASAT